MLGSSAGAEAAPGRRFGTRMLPSHEVSFQHLKSLRTRMCFWAFFEAITVFSLRLNTVFPLRELSCRSKEVLPRAGGQQGGCSAPLELPGGNGDE